MSWLFLDWFVPLYLLVSVLVLAGFGACLYFLEPGLQDAHKWRMERMPLLASIAKEPEDPYYVTMYYPGSVYVSMGEYRDI
uniref:small integral membrane protein 45 n=1 Tax=Centroberyx gerrardi TaxID=166262 RepID=UPI003AAC2D47